MATAIAAVRGKLSRSSTAFFVCDVQERFRDLIQYFPSVIHVSNQITRAAKILEVPVVVTEQYPKAMGKTVAEVDLSGLTFPPVEKMLFSMMTPEVDQHMKTNLSHIKSVALVGIEAHVCVLQTALDLLERQYQVFIVTDGVSSSRQADRMIALRRLEQAGCILTTSESLIFQMCETAKFARFKEISALMKEKRPDSGLLARAAL